MNFGFTEEQDLLREAARRFIEQRCPIGEVRRLAETEKGFSAEIWQEMARLGWLGLTLPEAHGGSGLGWIDLVVILEETGRGLVPSPLPASTLAATAILENGVAAQHGRWLPALAAGSRIGTVALMEDGGALDPKRIGVRGVRDGDGFVLSGRKTLVSDPTSADLFVVSFRCGDGPDDVALAVVEAGAPGVVAKSFPLIDATKRLGNLDLDGARIRGDQVLGAAGGAAARITRLLDQCAIAVTAEMAGAAERALRITVDYANERTQFGQPIGHFQGVKHPLAEMYVDIESFKSLLYYAAWALENRPHEVSRYASLAKAYATDAFVRTGIDSIQLHGATGFTVEYDIQLYFKRSKWARPMFGDAAAHYERALALRGV